MHLANLLSRLLPLWAILAAIFFSFCLSEPINRSEDQIYRYCRWFPLKNCGESRKELCPEDYNYKNKRIEIYHSDWGAKHEDQNLGRRPPGRNPDYLEWGREKQACGGIELPGSIEERCKGYMSDYGCRIQYFNHGGLYGRQGIKVQFDLVGDENDTTSIWPGCIEEAFYDAAWWSPRNREWDELQGDRNFYGNIPFDPNAPSDKWGTDYYQEKDYRMPEFERFIKCCRNGDEQCLYEQPGSPFGPPKSSAPAPPPLPSPTTSTSTSATSATSTKPKPTTTTTTTSESMPVEPTKPSKTPTITFKLPPKPTPTVTVTKPVTITKTSDHSVTGTGPGTTTSESMPIEPTKPSKTPTITFTLPPKPTPTVTVTNPITITKTSDHTVTKTRTATTKTSKSKTKTKTRKTTTLITRTKTTTSPVPPTPTATLPLCAPHPWFCLWCPDRHGWPIDGEGGPIGRDGKPCRPNPTLT